MAVRRLFQVHVVESSCRGGLIPVVRVLHDRAVCCGDTMPIYNLKDA